MRRSSILLASWLATSCLPEPQATGDRDAASGPLTVVVRDAAGAIQPATACSRRPRVQVVGLVGGEDAGLSDDERPLLLLGEPSEPLVEDARRRPWTSTSLARAAGVRTEPTAYGLELSFERPLDPGASFWLVVPAFLLPGGSAAEPVVRRFEVADAEAGAVLVETFPPDGTIDLGAGLEAIDLALDDRTSGADAIELRDESGSIVPTAIAPIACASTGLAGSDCLRIDLAATLDVDTGYELDCTSLRDRHGDAPCARPLRFRTTIDEPPPTPLAIPCALDERAVATGCVLARDDRISLRARFARIARVTLSVEGRSVVTITRSLEASLVVVGLGADVAHVVAVRVESSSGTILEHGFDARTTPRMPDVVLGEVRADALGPEPAQEYVELWNLGETPVDLGGFRVSDSAEREGDLLPSPLVVPRYGVVLVVADAFDPANAADVAPPPGAILARVGSSIASSGLTNSGEPLFLRDASGARVAEMPAVATPRAGTCIARLEDPYVHGETGRYAASVVGCSPGIR